MHKILWLTPELRRIYCVASMRDRVCGKSDCSLEVEILVARLFSLGLAIGLSSLAGLGLSTLSAAHAAHPVWSVNASQSKRPQFRPWRRTGRKTVSSRWRPHAAIAPRTVSPSTATRPAGSSTGHRVRQIPFSLDRDGSRNSSAMRSRKGFGGQFRPQRRGSTEAQPTAGLSAGLQSQFRPTRTQRRKSYEELQAGNNPTRGAAARGKAYPMMSARGAFGYAGYWPGW